MEPDKPIKPKISTRDRVLLAASNLFIQQGFHATSTKEIADQVSLTQPALYRHFKTKDDLMKVLANTYLDRTEQALKICNSLPVSPAARIYAFVHSVGHQISNTDTLPIALFTDPIFRNPALFSIWERYVTGINILQEMVADAIAQKQFHPVNTEHYSYFLTASMDQLLWVESNNEEWLHNTVDCTLHSVLHDRKLLPKLREELIQIDRGSLPTPYQAYFSTAGIR